MYPLIDLVHQFHNVFQDLVSTRGLCSSTAEHMFYGFQHFHFVKNSKNKIHAIHTKYSTIFIHQIKNEFTN